MLSISLCFFCLILSPYSPSLCLALSLSMSLAFSSHLSPSPATFQKNELLWAVTWPWPRIHFCGSSVSNCHFWQEPSHIITTWMDLDLGCFSFSLTLSHSLSSLSLSSLHMHSKKISLLVPKEGAGETGNVESEVLKNVVSERSVPVFNYGKVYNISKSWKKRKVHKNIMLTCVKSSKDGIEWI